MKGGMVQQFSVDAQHELAGGLFLDVGYVGNRGRDINNNLLFNVPMPGPGAVQARRQNPNYAAISLFGPATTSEYNGLEIRFEKRLSKGIQFLLSYTYSSAFDNSGTPQNPYDLAA
jgi:hypothetical protein